MFAQCSIAPYFKAYLDFALRNGEECGAFTAWTAILENSLIARLETVEEVHAVGGNVVIKAPI